MKVDPKLRVYGLLDSSVTKFPDLVSTVDGSTVAMSYYDAATSTVTYVFTDAVSGTETERVSSISFQMTAAMSIERSEVPTSGTYNFSIDFAGTPLDFTYDVSYSSLLPDPVYNNVYQKYELTSGRVLLDWINPETKRYEQSFLFGPVDKDANTIASRSSLDFGFDVLGSATPADNPDIHVYRVIGGASSIPENLDIPSSALEDVTSLFTVTSTEGGGLRYTPTTAGTLPTTDYYYVVVENGYSPSVNFDSGATIQNYAVDGTIPSDMAHISYGNQFSTAQLAGIATPTYAPRLGKKLEITKTDTDGNPLAGATFELISSYGTIVSTITTGEDGTATTDLVPLGTYRLHEAEAPKGYAAADDVTVDLETLAGNPAKVTVTDEKTPEPAEPTEPTTPEDPSTPTEPTTPETPTVPEVPSEGTATPSDPETGDTSALTEPVQASETAPATTKTDEAMPDTSDTSLGAPAILATACAGAALAAFALVLKRRSW